ncbi:protein kinase domain-containing protein [Sorangium sp. So ce1099]|uniref:protein kinase domain-containing protein n=1 Tax=Sorangium sp. So ce1099 TaxID=3133331 RepID=UPI003F61D37A
MQGPGDTAITSTVGDDGPSEFEANATRSHDYGRDESRVAAAVTCILDAAAGPEEAQAGRLIVGRYRLVQRLGAGAHGEVWAADDLVLGEPVALKWLRHTTDHNLPRFRREVTTLRMLRVPGVVRLLDDGIEDGRPFLVMERINGAPFPGRAPPRAEAAPRWTWAELAAPALSLLEVLSRVHAAGIVHRDLKPDNLLVCAEGRPTVLDFGISHWQDPTGQLTADGQILGTPLYLAPEQILDRQVDARTDLYAVGVMLYEALTGQIPHEARDVMVLLRRRLAEPALPVRELVPDLPAAAAEVIDRLLSTRIEQRFRSATEVLAALRGQPSAAWAGPTLPRLGDGRALSAALAAARAGRPIDVVGAPGSGRSRCLRDAAGALAEEARKVAWVRPARAPFGSLQPVIGAPEDPSLELAEAMAWAAAELRALLAGGVTVLADDAEQLDRWSAEVLERARSGPGPSAIIRALLAAPPGARPEEVARLEPLEEAALGRLFAGPDRLLHLREDAARLLWARTEGLPTRIDAEVTLWTRLGLARWDGALLVIDRDALSRLGAGVLDAPAAPNSMEDLSGEPHLTVLLRWLALGGQHLTVPQLAQVMQQPVWKVEAECEALVARGVARRLEGRRVVPRGQVDMSWPASRQLSAHRAIAQVLRPGHTGRLFHLLAADDALGAGAEAVALSERRALEGDLSAATAALAEGLRALRQRGGPGGADQEIALLSAWTKIAFEDGTPRVLDRVLYELSRVAPRGPEVQRLEALVRAGISASGASGARALEDISAIPPFADAQLERLRQRMRVAIGAARSSPALLEAVLAEVAAWAGRSGELSAQLSQLEEQARLRYWEGRFDEAAALHAAMAEREPLLTARIAATLSCASALLEAFQHEEAAERAAAGKALAAGCRQAFLEGRAEWLLRSALYRMGEARTPDLELVEAVERLGVQYLQGLVCLNEAAVGFRAGDLATAADLADRAAAVWRQMDRPWGAMLARSLSLACGATAQEGEEQAMAAHAVQCPLPGIGVQALGLLGRAFPEPGGDLRLRREAAERLVEGIPRARWALRMDVLSVEEALAWALGSEPGERGAGPEGELP